MPSQTLPLDGRMGNSGFPTPLWEGQSLPPGGKMGNPGFSTPLR